VLRVQVGKADDHESVVRAEIANRVAKRGVSVWQAQGDINREIRDERWKAVVLPAFKELSRLGVTVLEDKSTVGSYMAASAKVGHQSRKLSQVEAEAHRYEKCYAIWMNKEAKTVEHYCRNWLNHAEGSNSKSELVVDSATADQENKVLRTDMNKGSRQTAGATLEAVRQFISEKRNAKTIADMAFLLATDVDWNTYEDIGKSLGLKVDTRNRDGVEAHCLEVGLDVHRVIIAYKIARQISKGYGVAEKFATYEDEYQESFDAILKAIVTKANAT